MAVPVSSTSIQLTWRHLQPEERNGIIRSYRISVTELETGSVLNFTADETATQQIVNSLHPFYNYRCTVAAFTVGLGPSATTDVQTLPEGINLRAFCLVPGAPVNDVQFYLFYLCHYL